MKILHKGFKFLLTPSAVEASSLDRDFGITRWCWNASLAYSEMEYALHKKSSNYNDFNFYINLIKYEPGFEWIREAGSQTLQAKLKDLGDAYKAFFRKEKGKPNFKSKNDKQSLRYPQGFSVDYDESKIFIPKIGWVKAVLHRVIPANYKLKELTISKYNDQYYASINTEYEVEVQEEEINNDKIIGIDLGIASFVTTNEGVIYNLPDFSKKEKAKRRYQRRMSRCLKGSNNYAKLRKRKQRIEKRIADARKDRHHKISRVLIDENQVIVAETLGTAEMLRKSNSGLAHKISNAGLGNFLNMLAYKAEHAGKIFIQVDRYFPSSQLCSACGYRNHSLKLKDRTWTCPECGTEHDRDKNAATNVRNEGLRMLAQPDIVNTHGSGEIYASGEVGSALVATATIGRPSSIKEEAPSL